MLSLSRCLIVTATALLTGAAHAHEFWIEPQEFQVDSGAPLVADFKNGENFEGGSLAYFSTSTTRFDVIAGGTIAPVEGRMGDRPALNTASPADGLIVIVHESTPASLKYKTWEKFAKFAAHKDFADIEARHQALGFPREDFRESYTRHSKALMSVGNGAGADQAYGLKTEFVALTNPYADGFDGVMQVQVLLDGAPRAQAQVEVFARDPDGTVEITLHRTDAEGIANIAVQPGHDYLFDAVTLAPYEGPQDAVWSTYWAALTFSVPQ